MKHYGEGILALITISALAGLFLALFNLPHHGLLPMGLAVLCAIVGRRSDDV